MTPLGRLYLDTNVFIAMAEGTDELSDQLFAMAGEQIPGESLLCTSELTLAELVVQPYREGNNDLVQLYDDWINPGGWLNVRQVNRSVLWHAAMVRQHYHRIKLPDAIHIATAVEMGCSHILTGDKRIPEEIEVMNERRHDGDPAHVSILRLTSDIITEIRQRRP